MICTELLRAMLSLAEANSMEPCLDELHVQDSALADNEDYILSEKAIRYENDGFHAILFRKSAGEEA